MKLDFHASRVKKGRYIAKKVVFFPPPPQTPSRDDTMILRGMKSTCQRLMLSTVRYKRIGEFGRLIRLRSGMFVKGFWKE